MNVGQNIKNVVRISNAIGLQRETLLLSLTISREEFTGKLNSMCAIT